jgi:predicted ABC-type ATPase
MNENRPTLYIIAGPNGAGKTTFADRYLHRIMGCDIFLNADRIEAESGPQNDLNKGRTFLREVKAYVARRETFAIETTLSGRAYIETFKRFREDGYLLDLYFMWLPSADISVNRVRQRVIEGGHNIPTDVIRRRFQSGIKNLLNVYRPILDSWSILDARLIPPPIIASGRSGTQERIHLTEIYDKVREMGRI